MNSSRSSTEWAEDSLPAASQMFRQIEETIAKSRKVVEDSVALTRKNNQKRDQLQDRLQRISPSAQRLENQQALRQDRERTILDLRSRVEQLESKQRAVVGSPKDSGDLRQRLTTVLSQRDQYEEEALHLRSALRELEDLRTHESTERTQQLSIDLERELRENARLTQLVTQAANQTKDQTLTDEKLQTLEEKLADLEAAHLSQVRFNEELERKLEAAKPQSKAVFSQVSRLVSEHDDKMENLQQRLEDTEAKCEQLRDRLVKPESSESLGSVLHRASISDESLPYAKHKTKSKKRPETGKKVQRPERSRPVKKLK